MIRAALTAVFIGVLLAGCGPSNSMAGFVIEVNSTSVTEVESFVLRTQEGEEVMFRVGDVALGTDAFPATHLREHMALNQPIAVAFREDNGERVAYLLKDAPWLQQ